MSKTCGIIPPRLWQFYMDFSQKLPECILPERHFQENYIFETSDGRYITWYYDWECGCCGPDEEHRCYIYGEVDKP